MTDIKHASRKELTANEVLAVLERGGRVVIEMAVLGKTTKVVIRRSEDTYYCDTPMKLMKYDNPSELKACLERFKMVRYDGTELSSPNSPAIES